MGVQTDIYLYESSRAPKTCRHNDDLLCDKKGIWIRDDYSCSKWETQPWQQWRKSIMSKFLKTR